MPLDEELLEANEAVKYLAERWGMKSYSLVAFRSLRFRYNIEPAMRSRTATFWRKSDLDKIPKPDRSRPRGRKRADEASEGAGRHNKVTCNNTGLTERLPDLVA